MSDVTDLTPDERRAVLNERERCAEIARKGFREWKPVADRTGFTEFKAMADAAEWIEQTILRG